MKVVKFEFLRDFDWDTRPANCVFCQMVTWAYKQGRRLLVPEAAAIEAEAAGAGARLADDAVLDCEDVSGATAEELASAND